MTTDQAPDVPDYLLPEVPKPTPPPPPEDDGLEKLSKAELIRKVRSLRAELKESSDRYSDLLWERDDLARFYTMHNSSW